MGTSANETQAWTGKTAEYKLSGDVPEAIKGQVFKTREASTIEEFRTLVEDGSDENILKLAQSAWDIIVQRVLRNTANSEEVAEALKNDDVEGALEIIQTAADEYTYGARRVGTGQSAVTKQKAKQLDAVKEAAKADPELAERLRAMGIEV